MTNGFRVGLKPGGLCLKSPAPALRVLPPPSTQMCSQHCRCTDTYTQMITAACTRLNPVLTAQVKVGVVELNRRSSPVTSHTTPLSCLISQLKSALLNYFSRANNDSGSSIGELPHQSTEINPSQLLQVAVMRMLMTVSFVMRLHQHVAYMDLGLKGVRPHRI